MVPRWLPGSLFATFAVLVFALPASAGTSRAGSTVVTVKAQTILQMAGSDIYCTVQLVSGKPSVACFHDPGGLTSSARKGYAVVALDAGVAVEPPASNKPVKGEAQPSFATEPLIKGGKAHGPKAVVTLKLGDAALISGSRMAVTVQTAKGGGNAIGVLYLDANEDPIVGSYTIGISNQSVTIVKVATASTTKVVYRHSVY